MRRFEEISDGERLERMEGLVHKALLAYGLFGDLAFVAARTHVVFRLRSGGVSYAVRICPPGYDQAPLRRELTWLAALGRDTVLSVPEPILTLSGDLFRSVSMEGIPGTRACAVLRWVDGERREADLTPNEAAAMGRFAAALHAHAAVFRWPEEVALRYVDPASRAVAAADTLSEALASPTDRALLCDTIARVAEVTSQLGDGADSVGVIHGDLRLRKLRHDGGSVGAVGFDTCKVGAYLDDIAALWGELGGRESTESLRQALVEAYAAACEVHVAADLLDAFGTLRRIESVASEYTLARPGRGRDRAASERTAAALRRELAAER